MDLSQTGLCPPSAHALHRAVMSWAEWPAFGVLRDIRRTREIPDATGGDADQAQTRGAAGKKRRVSG